MPRQHEEDPVEKAQECKFKIALIADLLVNPPEEHGIDLTEEGTQGLYFFLRELESAIDGLVKAWPASA